MGAGKPSIPRTMLRLVLEHEKVQKGIDMALLQQSIAAATAVVGYDLLTSDLLATAQYARTIDSAGLAGSAAALDTIVDLYVGPTFIARLFNTAQGAVLVDAHMFGIKNVFVPAGQRVQAKVVDAPATNPINIAIETTP